MNLTARQTAFLISLRDHGGFSVPYNAPVRSLAKAGLVDVRSWGDDGGVIWATKKGNALVSGRQALEDKGS